MNNLNSKRREKWFAMYNEYIIWDNVCKASQRTVPPSKKLKDWIRYQTKARFEKNNLDRSFVGFLDNRSFKWDLAILNNLKQKNAINVNEHIESTSNNSDTQKPSSKKLKTGNDNKLHTLEMPRPDITHPLRSHQLYKQN